MNFNWKHIIEYNIISIRLKTHILYFAYIFLGITIELGKDRTVVYEYLLPSQAGDHLLNYLPQSLKNFLKLKALNTNLKSSLASQEPCNINELLEPFSLGDRTVG